jgi:hypothetical protein
MPAAAPAVSGSNAQQAPPPAAPFRAGTIRTLVQDGYQVSQLLGAATVQLLQYSPTPNAYLRGLWIQAVCTTSGNSATVTFAGDGPFNVFQSITFQDANQKPIVGPFDGYTLMLVNKFGGYQYNDDPRASATYVATTGGGGTGGSFTFVLYVPLEVDNRDTLGSLQNKSASSAFQLLLTVNTNASVYGTVPTSPGTLVTTVLEDGWLQPKSVDTSGTPLSQAPPQLGTTQYWTRGSYTALNGSVQVQLTQGLGYPIRQFLAVNYDTATGLSRATGDTNFPTSSQFIFRGTSFYNVTKTMWQDQMSRQYGFTATAKDSANGLENGVYALPFHNDFGLQDGDEMRNGYLVTQQGDQFQYVGTYTGSNTLFWVANYVAPAAGANNVASIRAGR